MMESVIIIIIKLLIVVVIIIVVISVIIVVVVVVVIIIIFISFVGVTVVVIVTGTIIVTVIVAGVPRTSRGGSISPWSCPGLPTRPFSSLAGPTGPIRPTRPSTACCSHPWGGSAALLQLWPAALRALGPSHRYTHTDIHLEHMSDHAGASLPDQHICSACMNS